MVFGQTISLLVCRLMRGLRFNYSFYSTAVRTGGPGMGGVSLLLIEKTMPGVTTRRMECQGVSASGTTCIY